MRIWDYSEDSVAAGPTLKAVKSPSEFIVPYVIRSTNRPWPWRFLFPNMTTYSLVISTYVPVYWGCVASIILLGTMLMQGSTYFSRNCSDSWMLKSSVSLLLFLDISQSGLLVYAIYYLFIINFGNVEVFWIVPVPMLVEGFITAVITFIVHLFFASRIYLLTREYAMFYSWHVIIPALIVVTALGSLASAIVFTTTMLMTPNIFEANKLLEITRCLEEGLSALSDIITTSTLCYVIASADPQKYRVLRSRNPWDRRQSPFRWLFFFLLTRGILATFVQIGTLAAYVSAMWGAYWVPLHFCKSKIYTNTLLMMLNSRVRTSSEVSGMPVMPQLATQEIAERIAELEDHGDQQETNARGQASDANETNAANTDDNRYRFVMEDSVV